jgi:eukaryotic-like serine/threonine-protein kinase
MSERFGNYELIEKVATGGMAEIFHARSIHGQGVQKSVCIKRIHPALSADGVFVGMFIDEARLGVSMVHGNIVPVFDFGCVDGRYYLAMEWVDGLDLAALQGRARVVGVDWPPELAVYVVIEVLEGLAYAHQKRDDRGRPLELVHRDVSPSNILLSLDGQVKLLDFGIARSEAREFQTRTGVIKGKPGYMSPEQAMGGEVDARADVWSCGAVLYELLTGTRLGDKRAPLADPELDAIVTRAISSFPKNRYPSARELQQALIAVLDARGARPRAADLAAFIARVTSATAPGQNWDMSSSAVEQHLAAALEAAQRDAAVSPVTEDDLATLPSEGERGAPLHTAVVTDGAAQRRRWLAIAVGVALVLAAVVGAWFLVREPGERAVDAAAPVSPPVAAPQPPGAGAVSPPQAQASGTPADAVAAGQPDAGSTAQKAQRARPANRAAQASRKAFLSVNSVPYSDLVLDHKPIGPTPILIERPLEIAPGRHVLVLTNPVSGASRTIQFTVARGEHKIVSEKL